jgi:hypothetical protein
MFEERKSRAEARASPWVLAHEREKTSRRKSKMLLELVIHHSIESQIPNHNSGTRFASPVRIAHSSGWIWKPSMCHFLLLPPVSLIRRFRSFTKPLSCSQNSPSLFSVFPSRCTPRPFGRFFIVVVYCNPVAWSRHLNHP